VLPDGGTLRDPRRRRHLGDGRYLLLLPVAALATAAVAALAVLNLSCGGDPAAPPSTVKPTSTVLTSPPPTLAAACPFGKGVFSVRACDEKTATVLLPAVESAMDRLIAEKPALFDLSNEYTPGSRAYKVLDREGYMNGLVANLVGAGLCAGSATSTMRSSRRSAPGTRTTSPRTSTCC
jgi:hypothetical protein